MGDIVVAALEAALDFGPRWLRPGCAAMLGAICIALLIWAFWPGK